MGDPGQDNYNGAYSFTVESIQHRMGLSLSTVTSVKPRGKISGSAVMTNSRAVPDGTSVSLIVTKGSQRWVFTDTARAGKLKFKLDLPTALKGRKSKMALYRSHTSTWTTSSSQKIKVRVG
jgi:hypothetical protein